MVNAELFARYSSQLDQLADGARQAVLSVVGEVMKRAGDRASMELFEGEFMTMLVAIRDTYGSAAAEAARQFYLAQRLLAGVTTPAPTDLIDVPDASFVAQDIGNELEVHADDKEKLSEGIASRIEKQVLSMSDWQMKSMLKKDRRKARWAFVPEPGACKWCVMIGSQGFAYLSQETAMAHRHANCRCKTVVDFDAANPSLEGYDPQALLKQYRDSQ